MINRPRRIAHFLAMVFALSLAPVLGPGRWIAMRVSRFVSRPVLVALFALLLIALASSDRAGKAVASGGPDNDGIATAIGAKEKHKAELLSTDGVVGAGVGLTADGQAAVKVFVERAEVSRIPRSLDGVPVVVEVTGKITALAKPEPRPGTLNSGVDTTARFTRPVPIGVSSGNEHLIKVNGTLYCTTGTLGARVKDGSGNVFALSNAHVYALEGSQAVDDFGNPVSVTSSRVLQPGRVDAGCSIGFDPSGNTIGTLAKKVTINFDGVTPNTVDAAIAATTTGNVGKATPSNGYGTPSSTPVVAALKTSVQKYGRTTQLTKGVISAIAVTINVGYDQGTARFENQIAVTGSKGAFIKGGDSGSLLVTQSGNSPTGLLFAGDSSGRYGFANQISNVLTAFGVTIDGGP